ncbi:MAG: TetR/AcrR family transcriptional regulator [Phycisphaeraceae bacterium]
MSSITKTWPLPERPVVVNPVEKVTHNNHAEGNQQEQAAKPRSRAPLSRDQILEATQVCLNDLGYDGTTIRKIASQLGCAVGSIYRYFKDKRDLLAEVTQRRFDPVLELIEDGAPAARSLERYIEVASAEPEQYRLMFWLASLSDKEATRALPGMIEKLLAAWSMQTGASAEKLDAAWCVVHGGLMIGLPTQQLVDRAMAVLGEGDRPAGMLHPAGRSAEAHAG